MAKKTGLTRPPRITQKNAPPPAPFHYRVPTHIERQIEAAKALAEATVAKAQEVGHE